jgi:hypothetical protein
MARRTRASVEEWGGFENIEHRELTEDDANAIIARVNVSLPPTRIPHPEGEGEVDRPRALRWWLQGAIANYSLTSRGHSRPKAREEIKKFAEINVCAHALLTALGALRKGSPLHESNFDRMPYLVRVHLVAEEQRRASPHLKEPALVAALLGDFLALKSAEDCVRAAVRQVAVLAHLADAAEKNARSRAANLPARDTGKNFALEDLFGGMAHIYSQIWERRPGLSVGNEFGARGRPSGPFFRFCQAVLALARVELGEHAIAERIRSTTRARVELGEHTIAERIRSTIRRQ